MNPFLDDLFDKSISGRRPIDAAVKRCETINISCASRDRGRSINTLLKIIHKYLNTHDSTRNMTFLWSLIIVKDPCSQL